MMDSAVFAATLTQWHDFYMLAGTASATLVGLLFLSVSLRLDVVKAGAGHMFYRARQGLVNFLFVLSIALVCMVPDITPDAFAEVLGGLALLAIIRAIRGLLRARTGHLSSEERREELSLWPFVAPFAAYLALLVCAVMFHMHRPDVFDWMIGVVITLLMSAVLSSWNLLIAERG